MPYDLAEHQERLDEIVADVAPHGACAERLRNDDYPHELGPTERGR